ncbi:hypothetical protein [Listeria kieliensis]|uniref:Uncharacterized protein n=1 Tax=Listeria kieliensis TaxID=1621700 RepID=A0A3D8TQ89_9LIST|nr:hypothetical protein [Listeria kieliensis]RDX00811.1 hypothetical protein UR08_07470 [Listeria kieliensis]
MDPSEVSRDLIQLNKIKPFIFFSLFIMVIEQRDLTPIDIEHEATVTFQYPLPENYASQSFLYWQTFFKEVEIVEDIELLSVRDVKQDIIEQLNDLYKTQRLPKGYAAFYKWLVLKEEVLLSDLEKSIPFFIDQILYEYDMSANEHPHLEEEDMATIFPICRKMTKEINEFVQEIFAPYFKRIKVVVVPKEGEMKALFVELGEPYLRKHCPLNELL